MRAVVNGQTIAESDDTTVIEGKQYFPPESVDFNKVEDGDRQYTCPWKGEANYYHIRLGDQIVKNAAWSYPEPPDSAISRVGRDFAGYVAFDPSSVEVKE